MSKEIDLLIASREALLIPGFWPLRHKLPTWLQNGKIMVVPFHYLKNYITFIYVMKEANISYGVYAEVKGQVSRTGSLLPQCCSWGLSSNIQALWLYPWSHLTGPYLHCFKQQIHWAKGEAKDLLTHITEKNRGERWGMSHWRQLRAFLLVLLKLCLYFSLYVELCVLLRKDFLHVTEWTQPWQTIESCFSIQQSQKNMRLTALFGVQIEVSWSITH